MDQYEKLTPETADVFRRMDQLGLRQRDLALILRLEPNKISKVRSGERQLKAMELIQAREWLKFMADRHAESERADTQRGSLMVEPDLAITRGIADSDGAIALKRINIGFAMGDGSNLDDYVEEGRMDFDANLLRLISSSPAHRLVVADGIGDSMQPTLMDSDLIVIDTLQNQLNKWDRIWALSLQGAGAVKRLGPAERGKVEIISDNPAIPNRVVPMEDVRIIGRVVWSSRRH